MAQRNFTKEEIEILEKNPYTLKVTENQLRLTYEFKEYYMQEIVKPGMNSRKVFQSAGYDPEMLGHMRMDFWNQKIKKEAASPEGLKIPRGSREAELAAYAKKEMTKKQQKTLIKELHTRVVYLEQEIEFLKKIYRLENTERSSK